MPQAPTAAALATRAPGASVVSDRLMGLAVIAGAPTVFWTLLVYLATWAMDAPLSMSATLTIAAAVFAFLVCIWAAFALADRRPSRAA